MLSPALLTALKSDGFRCPVPAGTTFQAGDVVPIGALLVGVAANDYNWQGSTGSPNSVNLVGLFTVPKLNTESIAAGVKLAWGSTGQVATAVASTSATQYPLGVAAAASTGTSIDVLVWPGTGLGY
jgi:predicted RecA/RadA family phage recombinase